MITREVFLSSASCKEASVGKRMKNIMHNGRWPGLEILLRVNCCFTLMETIICYAKEIVQATSNPYKQGQECTVCALLDISTRVRTGAEIPFLCRGGQYMVKFQRVIPGGGHEKIAFGPHRPLSVCFIPPAFFFFRTSRCLVESWL